MSFRGGDAGRPVALASASVSTTQRDVIVVGGGHNGLACAAYLAKAGRDVLVLERRDVLGGAAVTEPMWDGYRISSAAYVVSLLPERIVTELDLKAFGYRVSIVSPDYFVPFPDGTSLTFWGDLRRDVENIARSTSTTPRPTWRSIAPSSTSAGCCDGCCSSCRRTCG